MSDQEPTTIGQAAAEVAGRRTLSSAPSSGRTNNSKSSAVSRKATGDSSTLTRCLKNDFARAMAHLTAMKRTADLSDLQLVTWHGALSVFPKEIINAAVLEIALTDVRFPELGDLYQLCRAKALKAGILKLGPYTPHGDGKEKTITAAEVREIGARLGLAVI